MQSACRLERTRACERSRVWALDAPEDVGHKRGVLHYNRTHLDKAGLQGGGAGAASRTHLAHAAVVAMHLMCCGAPVLAVAGAALGLVALGGAMGWLHALVHGHELVLLALSGCLVAAGGFGEWAVRGSRRGVPVLFAVSVACLALNVAIVASHRLPGIAGAAAHVEAARR